MLSLKRLLAVAALAHDLDVRLAGEAQLEAAPGQGLVVHDQGSDRLGHAQVRPPPPGPLLA